MSNSYLRDGENVNEQIKALHWLYTTKLRVLNIWRVILGIHRMAEHFDMKT